MKRVFSTRVSSLLNLVVGAVFVLVAVTIVILVNRQTQQQALAEAESKALIILDRNLATHTYFTHNLKPNLFEWTEPFRPDDYFDPVWMSSTYAVREIDKYFKSLSPADYYYKESAINARSPENEADAYERAFIEELNTNPELVERSVVRTLDGKPYFVVLRRGEQMEASCLRCHDTPDRAPGGLVSVYGPERSFGREEGEVVSAISIRIPLAAAYAEAGRFSWLLSGSLLTLLLGLFVAQFWLNRRLLFAPLDKIRDKARQISTGGEHLGEEIPLPFGRELSELTAAFNTMSVGLRRNVDQLEERVQARTVELEGLNVQLQRDIAARMRAEEALKEYSERLEEMVDERTQELRDAQEQLVRREKLAVLGQLAGSVSHELRNPLGVISGAVYYLQMVLSDADEDTRQYLDIISKQVRNSDKIITDLLDFSRTRMPERERVTVSDLVAQALIGHPPPEGVEVTTQMPPDLPPVYVDPRQMEQVLGNLVTNGYQAMPEGGQLTISADHRDGPDDRSQRVLISIADTGHGIPEEDMGKLFEPLFTTKPKGIGLGLAVSRGLVEANGGDIEVESEEGEGSTFTLRLPAG